MPLTIFAVILPQVRAYWNVKGDVRSGAWQGIMRGYYAASLLAQRQVRGCKDVLMSAGCTRSGCSAAWLPTQRRDVHVRRVRAWLGACECVKSVPRCSALPLSVCPTNINLLTSWIPPPICLSRQALDLRWQHGPPAVAGELFSRPVALPSAEEEGAGEAPGPEGMEVDGEAAPTLGAGAVGVCCGTVVAAAAPP